MKPNKHQADREGWEIELRERLAKLAHEQWSGWMEYLFSKCELDDDVATIPEWATERWQRQMLTPYGQLPEEEKESDRKEADKYLAILRQTLTTYSQRVREEVVGQYEWDKGCEHCRGDNSINVFISKQRQKLSALNTEYGVKEEKNG